jgi:hypothetical protein
LAVDDAAQLKSLLLLPLLLLLFVAGPKAPAAGSTASKLAADDAAQLKSLLAFKGYVDDSNILKGQWTAAGALGGRGGGEAGAGGGGVQSRTV